MATLTTKERNALPSNDFALGGGHYPIPDENHARAALQRVSQFGTEAEKAIVRSKVRNKFPTIHQGTR